MKSMLSKTLLETSFSEGGLQKTPEKCDFIFVFEPIFYGNYNGNEKTSRSSYQSLFGCQICSEVFFL